MLPRMSRTRAAAMAVLGVFLAAACASTKLNNGEECLKNADCESDRCVQYVCVDPNSSRIPIVDSGSAGDSAGETAVDTGAAPAEAAAETAAETSTDAGAD